MSITTLGWVCAMVVAAFAAFWLGTLAARNVEKVKALVRPFIGVEFATAYLALLALGVYRGTFTLEATAALVAGPMGMILGFWFKTRDDEKKATGD